jgi:RimJ/RimL family protein N-acetyltransferase
MTAAVHAIIEDYAVPYMNVRRIRTRVFEHNIGSRRVFEKNGFTFQGLGPQPLILPENRGGHGVFLGTLTWERALE